VNLKSFDRKDLVTELPGAISYEEYREHLEALNSQIKAMPTGRAHAEEFEETLGEMLKLCFFRTLTNIEDQVREIDGVIRRDWVASNRGENGFWYMVRQRYDATQVLFECKNYEDLKAGDFQQVSYYMTEHAGKFVVVFFRGELKNHYFQHIKRISAASGGLVLLLNDKDMRVFIRQSINGRVKDSHIQDRYDKIVRAIS
jgi:hypothetical protein